MTARRGSSDSVLGKVLTPAGGMILSLGVGGLMWSAVAVAMHLAGAF